MGGNSVSLMSAKVICFASAKGGTGKTICSASFAKLLAGLGKKILLIDMDAATNGLSLLYIEELIENKKRFAKEEILARGIFEVTDDEIPVPFEIDNTIDMIPATFVLKQTEGISEDNFRRSILKALSTFRDKYNYIILDSQAGSDIYSQIAIENADMVVIVSEYDPISAEGVDRFRRLFPEDLSYSKTWILLNKVLPEFSKSLREFLSIAQYLSPIPWDAEVVRATVRRKLAIDMERGNEYTLGIMRAASTLLKTEIDGEISLWKKEKEASIREPELEKLELIQNEIAYLREKIIDTDYKLIELKRRPKRLLLIAILESIMISIFAYFLFDFGIISSTFIFNLIIGIIVLMISAIVVFMFLIENKYRKKEIEFANQAAYYSNHLQELDYQRNKLKIIVDSDLETILENKNRG